MMNFEGRQAVKSYQTVGAHAQVAAADPYKLVQLMFTNVAERLAVARGHLERGEIARKGEQISKAIAVLNALDGSLNMTEGGEIAKNLHDLYGYMIVRLVKANSENDASGFDEVGSLLKNIKEGWDGIADQARAASPAAHP